MVGNGRPPRRRCSLCIRHQRRQQMHPFSPRTHRLVRPHNRINQPTPQSHHSLHRRQIKQSEVDVPRF